MILTGDCLEIMPTLEAESIDSIVTDPPYGLKFMGKSWDHGVPGIPFWEAALRVAKPGAFLLAFGGTRTFHRLAVAIEDAGWEIRDTVMWVYGSGFPKSLDVSKAIDKAAGAERKSSYIPNMKNNDFGKGMGGGEWNAPSEPPVTDNARQWEGWGTALKPAWEPIIVARKPIIGTVAENVLKYGTGGLNIDGCRVETDDNRSRDNSICQPDAFFKGKARINQVIENKGRWPANLIHDGSDEVVGLFPLTETHPGVNRQYAGGSMFGLGGVGESHGSFGSAARFFYCAKASKQDRDEGCENLPERPSQKMGDGLASMVGHPSGNNGNSSTEDRVSRNFHPTVKPTALMRYLCRLVTPPGGVILDPFMGSGSTGKAAEIEGFKFIGIDLNPEYAEISEKRIDAARLPLFNEP